MAASIWKYLDSRKREPACKRTEFLFEQAEKLDNDEAMQRAVRVLAGRDSVTIIQLFGPTPCLS